MANYTPDQNVKTALSNLLVTSGLNQTELNQFVSQLNSGSLPATFEKASPNHIGSITTGTDVVFVQGGGTINLGNLSDTTINDLNALIFEGSNAVSAQLPQGFGGTVVLGKGSDTIISTGDKAVQILADAGNDMVVTGNGNSVINAGSGNNVVISGAGNDSVVSGRGNDTINVGNGKNNVISGAGNDTITSGSGNDTIKAGYGNDKIDAGNGNNNVNAGPGNDTVTTGTGKDTVNGGAGNDSINTGAGNDSIVAGAGNDSINAGSGNDAIVISRDTGNNTINIDGGLGLDKLVLSDLNAQVSSVSNGSNGLVINLVDHTTLHVSNVEKFVVDFNHDGAITSGESVTLVGLVDHNFNI